MNAASISSIEANIVVNDAAANIIQEISVDGQAYVRLNVKALKAEKLSMKDYWFK